MIRPLRRAHRRIILMLLVLLPALMAAAVMLRPDVPVQTDWPFQ